MEPFATSCITISEIPKQAGWESTMPVNESFINNKSQLKQHLAYSNKYNYARNKFEHDQRDYDNLWFIDPTTDTITVLKK